MITDVLGDRFFILYSAAGDADVILVSGKNNNVSGGRGRAGAPGRAEPMVTSGRAARYPYCMGAVHIAGSPSTFGEI